MEAVDCVQCGVFYLGGLVAGWIVCSLCYMSAKGDCQGTCKKSGCEEDCIEGGKNEYRL